MKTLTALLLLAALPAFAADPPKTFPAGDGCNTCTDLGNGFAECTLMACTARPVIFAQAADAPTRDLDASGRSLILEAGDPVPFRGTCLDEQEAVSRERSRVRSAAALADAQSNAWLSPPLLVALIVGGLVLGAGVGAGVTALALRK